MPTSAFPFGPALLRHRTTLRIVAALAGWALGLGALAPLAHAQSVYATPYYFDVALGTPGVPSLSFGLDRPIGVSIGASGIVYWSAYNSGVIVVGGAAYPFGSGYGFAGVAATAPGEMVVTSYLAHQIIFFRGINSSTTLAGLGPGYQNGTGFTASFRNPIGVAVDKNGIIYVADQGNHAIRKITPAGVVTTLAGGGPDNPGSANGTGTAARFNLPSGVAVDGDLNVYVGDSGNNAIRKITAAGIVTTLAGPQVFGGAFPGSADGTGSAARFNSPWGVAVDGAGVVYVCDSLNHTLRRISPAGEVTTIAGLALTPGTANGSGSAARFRVPANVALDAEGNLWVSDSENHTIRRSHFPPRFSAHPAAQVVIPGVTANFSATAASSLTATYQWRKDGVAIPGATTTALTVANVQVANLGAYTVVATTAAGSITSNAAALSFAAAPSFTTQPASQTAAVSAAATFTASATGAGLITYQWLKDGGAIPGATTTTLTIPNVQAANLGTYAIIASNGSGPTVSNPATLGFTQPPSFTTQPASQSVAAGATATFTASATGTGLITYQWLKDGSSIPGATTTTLTIANVQTANLGNYVLIASNAGGPATSNPATLSFPTPPSFTNHPDSESVVPGTSATFIADATSGLPFTYQWRKDGVAIPGATATTLTVSNVQVSNLGIYTLVATNSVGSTTSDPATLSFNTSNAGRLTNLSIRTNAGTGAQTLIVGFVVGGTNTAGTKPLLIRGVGPTLGVFGVPGFLVDPTLSVYSGTTVVSSNDNWNGDAQITATGTQVGAFALGAAVSRDAALYSPALNVGAYTVQVAGVGGTTGITLAEIYDATPVAVFLSSTPRLINVSARTQVGTGADILITGFTIGGTTAKTLLIRAVGPTLGVFGVTGTLADPKLDLYSGTTVINSNDNWGGGAAITAAAANVGAFALDGASRDAVLLVTLQPGSYTAQVSGVGNTTGVALVEIYDVP